MTNYLKELKRAMMLLNDNGYYFIGQNCIYGGTSMFHTITHVPEERRIELPVMEEVQMGITTGMSLTGLKVCSIYPRFDFLILAINQLINHLDKADEMSDGQFKPNPIIRVAVGSVKPLMPGPQHCQNYYNELKTMCKNIEVVLLDKADRVYTEYEKAIHRDKPTILIELPDLYNQDLENTFIKSREHIIT